jgi:hypothetical protein
VTMKRTFVIGVVAAVVALGGGAFVAGAADHPNFAGSSEGRGGPGGGPPNGFRPGVQRDE